MTYRIAEAVRAKGLSRSDFHPGNVMAFGGGLKGAQLPDGFQQFIEKTFNVDSGTAYRYFGMQEINTTMPISQAGRYHVPSWLVLLLLDQTGDARSCLGKANRRGWPASSIFPYRAAGAERFPATV